MKLLSKTIFKEIEEAIQYLDKVLLTRSVSKNYIKNSVEEIDDLYFKYHKASKEEKERETKPYTTPYSTYHDDCIERLKEIQGVNVSNLEIRYNGGEFSAYETSFFGLVSFPLKREGFRCKIHCSGVNFYWAYYDARRELYRRAPIKEGKVVF